MPNNLIDQEIKREESLHKEGLSFKLKKKEDNPTTKKEIVNKNLLKLKISGNKQFNLKKLPVSPNVDYTKEKSKSLLKIIMLITAGFLIITLAVIFYLLL